MLNKLSYKGEIAMKEKKPVLNDKAVKKIKAVKERVDEKAPVKRGRPKKKEDIEVKTPVKKGRPKKAISQVTLC